MDNITKAYIAAQAYKTIEDLLDKKSASYRKTLESISDIIDIIRAMNDAELKLLLDKEIHIDKIVI